MLSEQSDALIVQSRFPSKVEAEQVEITARVIQLGAPTSPGHGTYEEFQDLLARAIRQCIDSNEFLVVEPGGWDSPFEPYCLFMVAAEPEGLVNVIETVPTPYGATHWEPHIVPNRETTNLSAPTSAQTLDVVPFLMIEAIVRWELEPWDLALTFGRR